MCKAIFSYSQILTVVRDHSNFIGILRLREVDSEFDAAMNGPKSSLGVKAPVKVNIPRPSMKTKGQPNDELECFIVNEKKFEHRIVLSSFRPNPRTNPKPRTRPESGKHYRNF